MNNMEDEIEKLAKEFIPDAFKGMETATLKFHIEKKREAFIAGYKAALQKQQSNVSGESEDELWNEVINISIGVTTMNFNKIISKLKKSFSIKRS